MNRYFIVWYEITCFNKQIKGNTSVRTENDEFLNLVEITDMISSINPSIDGEILITDFRELTKDDFEQWVK